MTAQILDGRRLALALRAEVREAVAARRRSGRAVPGLAVILVGEDPASQVYVRNKERACVEAGFHSVLRRLPDTISAAGLFAELDALNADPRIHGILVQLPLPPHIDSLAVIDHIDPAKDVDGYHPYNIGRLAIRAPLLRPCTPKGIMTLLDCTGLPYKGTHAVVVGASNHVGRPMGLELLLAGCTVTTAHRFTRDTAALAATADILVSAVGRPGLVQAHWIKPGAAVIDVGITRSDSGKLQGDIDFPAVSARAGWVTPVPGGVGPMTVATLLQNTLQAAEAS